MILHVEVPDELRVDLETYIVELTAAEVRRRTDRQSQNPDVVFLPNPITLRNVVVALLRRGLASKIPELSMLELLYEVGKGRNRRGRPTKLKLPPVPLPKRRKPATTPVSDEVFKKQWRDLGATLTSGTLAVGRKKPKSR